MEDLQMQVTELAIIGSVTARLGSVAVVQTDSSSMTALEWKADAQPGRMSAFTVTGHLEALKRADLNDR